VATIIARQMAEFFARGTVRGAVNFPSLNAEQLAELGPYLALGEKLGRFLGQAFGHDGASIDVGYAGDVASYDVRPVTQAILTGTLSAFLEGVNYVNASVVAEERGVPVTVSTSTHARDYASTIGLRVRSTEGEHEVIGALFGAGDPRIVRVDGFNIEAIPTGHMVLLSNRDVPGVIGHVASRIGAAGVNIARFYLGRKAAGGEAMALVQVDEPIGDALLAELATLPDVLEARRITL
jgi:D-3-phosphoglycerate dehydrogenase